MDEKELRERYEQHTVRGSSKRQNAPASLLWHCAYEQRQAASRELRLLTFVTHGNHVAGKWIVSTKDGCRSKDLECQFGPVAFLPHLRSDR